MDDIYRIAQICKEKYINDLCGYYGNPQDVRDHLQSIASEHPLLAAFLKKDIEKFDEEIKEEYEDVLESESYLQENCGGCASCPWENGEGGCTLPHCDMI